MEISADGRKVRVCLSEEETADASLSYESFGRGDKATERFLSRLLMLLRERGLLPYGSDALDVAVSEEEGGLCVEISPRRGNTLVLTFDDPAGFEERLHSLCRETQPEHCELWKFSGGWALISLSKEYPYSPEMKLLAAIIREHGSRLSDSPFELI